MLHGGHKTMIVQMTLLTSHVKATVLWFDVCDKLATCEHNSTVLVTFLAKMITGKYAVQSELQQEQLLPGV